MVFDIYREDSIMNVERSNSGSTSGIHLQNMGPGHRIQQWRKFLSSSANKANLKVPGGRVEDTQSEGNDRQLYVASEETCLHITNEQWAEVAGLSSNQEEADTRIILHAAHAAEEGYRAVVVTAEDTDVMFLCLALSPDISCPLFQKCGTKNRVRYIDINQLRHGLGDDVFNYLIGMQSYTGCDTVSAFVGRGKPGALKLMRS